jgi:hypothetical protein
MTKTIFSVLTILYLTSCNSGQVYNERSQIDTPIHVANAQIPISTTVTIPEVKNASNSADSLKSKLKGAWTDGATDDATFDVKDKTIFYVDLGSDYKYSLRGDVISIKYPDYTYKAKVSCRSDTLTMSSDEYGETKFWRFNH